jgi:hypothetical protein
MIQAINNNASNVYGSADISSTLQALMTQLNTLEDDINNYNGSDVSDIYKRIVTIQNEINSLQKHDPSFANNPIAQQLVNDFENDFGYALWAAKHGDMDPLKDEAEYLFMNQGPGTDDYQLEHDISNFDSAVISGEIK